MMVGDQSTWPYLGRNTEISGSVTCQSANWVNIAFC